MRSPIAEIPRAEALLRHALVCEAPALSAPARAAGSGRSRASKTRALPSRSLGARGKRAGFTRRAGNGSHTIFYKEGVTEILNLQAKGGEAKPYQVKQVRDLILKYQLEID